MRVKSSSSLALKRRYSSVYSFQSPSFRQCSVSTPCPLLMLRIAVVDIFVKPMANAFSLPSA